MEPTIFTRIIRGEIPSYKLYEDELTFAFLDIHPIQPGHALVIPKKQIEFVWDLPGEDYAAVMDTAKRTALRLRQVMGTAYVAERIIGVDVPHAHVQLIPFNDASELAALQRFDIDADPAELAKLAQALAF